ncbi:MAG: hypothetical protein AM326_07460 [Candidatus Thorarchaeota archaeon SMTZ-45]|nr:MAG: hypothetical protein AM325_04855 [Candidatus Thorarchaeota archaeon SMTZ1-45]KXH76283.1 MAG: hypothetical protein AM326_07460 [Candidatus Thorarchaeota archaeon SMTZ-45]
MKQKITLLLVITLFIFPAGVEAQTNDYSSFVAPGTRVTWEVSVGTNFTMWYSGGGYCVVENESEMIYDISHVNEDVYGSLYLGNVTVAANDTVVALDLTLGIWPAWLTGLFVEVGQENIDSLNASAYAAAERVAGNWMNGTIDSLYANYDIGQTTQECIEFHYYQDPPGTQITHLVYSLETGVLVRAETMVTFGSVYRLVIALQEINRPVSMILVIGFIGAGALVAIVIVYVQWNRRTRAR